MKKMCALLAAVLILTLCACGADPEPQAQQAIVRKEKQASAAPAEGKAEEADRKQPEETEFEAFVFQGQVYSVGKETDPAGLPAPDSVYEAPSCAIEGTDLVYQYADFEVTLYDGGEAPVIYSVFFVTPEAATPEGLTLGDGLDRMLELYGEGYEQDGTAYNYLCDGVLLSILVQNETVISIEYRLAS